MFEKVLSGMLMFMSICDHSPWRGLYAFLSIKATNKDLFAKGTLIEIHTLTDDNMKYLI